MNVIDKDGNIFGKVNIVDLSIAVVVLVGAVVGCLFVFDIGLAQSEETETQTEKETKSVTVTYQASGVPPYVSNAIQTGTINRTPVMSVENRTVEPTTVYVADQDGEFHAREHPYKKTVTLDVTLQVTEQGDDLQLKDGPLEIGRDLTLDFGNTTLEGEIIEI